VAEDAHLWPQPGRTTILPTKNDLRQTDLGHYQDGAGNMILARRMNELELGRLFRTPPDLMLELSKNSNPARFSIRQNGW
jgi:hypothetical protein